MYAVIKNFMNGDKKVVYKTADLLQARDYAESLNEDFDDPFSGKDNEAVSYGYNGQHCKGVRKWDDTEWHEPTADYIGLEE